MDALADVAARVRTLSRTPGPHDGAVDALRDGVASLKDVLARVVRAPARDGVQAQQAAQLAVLVLGDVRAAIEEMENDTNDDERRAP